MRDLEQRYTSGVVEVREAPGAKRVGGYAAKFNTKSQNLGGFVERIAPGFFDKSAADGWPGVMARYNHDDNFLLGTTRGSTLRLVIDGTGLDYEADLPNTRAAQDVFELVARGDVAHSSFAFYTFEDDWALDEHGFPMRTLVSGRLVDVAPVNSPAYLDTSTGLRSLAASREVEVSDVERLARSNDLAKLLTPTPLVIDLGARATDSESAGQAQATSPVRLQVMRRVLEMKQPR